MTPEQEAEFKRLRSGGMTPEQQAEFKAVRGALPKASRGTRGRPPNAPLPVDDSQFTIGEGMTDLARAAGGSLADSAEFITDTSQIFFNPTDWGERHRAGLEATRPESGERGVVDALTAFPKYAYGAMTHETAQDKFNKATIQRDIYDEQIPKGVSPILDTAKRATKLAVELGMTGWMAGPTGKAAMTGKEAVKEGLKTGLAMTTAGTVGGEMFDTGGEIGGVIAGAMSREPKSLAALADMVAGVINKSKRGLQNVKRSVLSGDTLDTASDSEIREGMRVLLRNYTMPDGSPMTAERYDEILPMLEEALKSNKRGSLSQLVDDAGIRQFEQDFASDKRSAQYALDTIDEQIAADARESVNRIAEQGDAAQASALPRARLAERTREVAETVEAPNMARLEASKAEEAAREPFAAALDRPASSTVLSGAVQKKADESYKRAKKKWDEVTGGKKIAKTDVTDEFTEFFTSAKLDDVKQARLKRAFPDTFKEIEALGKEVDLDDINDILSVLTSEAYQLKNKTKTGSGLQHVDGMKEALYAALTRSSKTGSQSRKTAAKLYRQHMENFGDRAAIGKAMKADDALVGEKLIKPNPAGAVQLQKMLEVTGATDEAADVLRSRFKEEAMDDDGINATGLKAFEKKYREHLKLGGMEKLADEVYTASDRVNALRDTTKAAETAAGAAKKQITELRKSPLGKYATTGQSYEEAVKAAARSVSPKEGRDVIDGMRKLVDEVKGDTKAFDDVRRSFADDLYTKMFTGDGGLKPKALQSFKQKRDVYEKSGMFTKKELDYIEEMFVEGGKLELGSGKRLASVPKPERRIQQGIAALIGAKLGAQAFGSPLIGAALGRKFAVDQLGKMTDEKASKLAFELAVNPEKYVDWIKKLSGDNLSKAQVKREVSGLLEAAARSAKISLIDED